MNLCIFLAPNIIQGIFKILLFFGNDQDLITQSFELVIGNKNLFFNSPLRILIFPTLEVHQLP